MKRRDFIKSLASLPFVGSIVAWLAPKPALGVDKKEPEKPLTEEMLNQYILDFGNEPQLLCDSFIHYERMRDTIQSITARTRFTEDKKQVTCPQCKEFIKFIN